jgi:hypothetical protein
MLIFRALRATVVSVATCAGLMLLFAAATQAERGRWSLGHLWDFTISLTWPLLIAVGIVGLPAFAVLSRLTALLEAPPVAMAAGAALVAPPAVIIAAAYLGQGVEAPQSLGEWVGFFGDNPGTLIGWLAPYALSGAVFGYLWSTWQDTRVVRSEP